MSFHFSINGLQVTGFAASEKAPFFHSLCYPAHSGLNLTYLISTDFLPPGSQYTMKHYYPFCISMVGYRPGAGLHYYELSGARRSGSHDSLSSGEDDDLATGCVIFHAAVRFNDCIQLKHTPDLERHTSPLYFVHHRLQRRFDEIGRTTRVGG